jgi:alkane 1-monooxygenase
MTPADPAPALPPAAPFWLSLVLFPLAAAAVFLGGWAILLLPLYGMVLTSILDAALGHETRNPDTTTPEERLFWHRLVTLVWFPLQFVTIYGTIWWATRTDHLSAIELLGLMFGVSIVSGGIGIVYAHELMHQKTRAERWLADLLLATVLYSHFRTEHLKVHHRYVGTPRDTVTARYNEGFYPFFARVLIEGPGSAWRAEAQMLARRGRGAWHISNPFWLYGLLQMAAVLVALAVGGWTGLVLFLLQAFFAVAFLELVNYVEHYGLTREDRGEGDYEPTRAHHSWNADHKVTNWLLINLQRHSDHHARPDRRFPLLQTYGEGEAPTLPWGYPVMTAMATVPPLWRRVMNPRVRAWRKRFYPEVKDWSEHNSGDRAMPKGTG